MIDDEEAARADARLQTIHAVLLVVAVVAVIPTAIGAAYAMSWSFWFLVDHKGWARAAVGVALATTGSVYAWRHRPRPKRGNMPGR
jgi:hypothetical protein